MHSGHHEIYLKGIPFNVGSTSDLNQQGPAVDFFRMLLIVAMKS